MSFPWRTRRDALWGFALSVVVCWGAMVRAAGLTSGTLFRDDAWVALGGRLPLGTAWRTVGSAPLFNLAMRSLWSLGHHHTWIMQLPAFLVSILGLVVLGVVARLVGLTRLTSLGVVALVAASRVDIAYATHLKPYAHDILASTLILLAAWWWKQGHRAWWLTAASALFFCTSFTIAPLVLGVGVAVLFTTPPSRRRALGRATVIPLIIAVAVAASVHLSTRLDSSWRASFVNWHSPATVCTSLWSITRSLVWGLADTTPNWYVPGLGSLILVVTLIGIVNGMRTRGFARVPAMAVVAAYACAALHIAPLGTGRTDAYLHPALVLLMGFGAQSSVVRFQKLNWPRFATALPLVPLVCVPLVGIVDHTRQSTPYPGGNWHAVTSALATACPPRSCAVIVEGTARWPWALYSDADVQVGFSSNYNTGFYPLSPRGATPYWYVMPGSSIEGGYDPAGMVSTVAARSVSKVAVVYATDWLKTNPLAPALRAASWLKTTDTALPGYRLQVWSRP